MSGSKEHSHFKRRRRRGSYLGVTGKFPSPKSAHSLFYESLRERDLFVALAFQPDVLQVEDHPFSIEYETAGRRRTYTPDARILYQPGCDGMSRCELVEVKMERELERKSAEYEPVFEAARRHCEAHGMTFRIVTETHLPRPYVRNLRFLFPYRATQAHEVLAPRLLELGTHGRTLAQLCTELDSEGFAEDEVVAQAWRLIAQQQMRTDLHLALSMDAIIETGEWTARL